MEEIPLTPRKCLNNFLKTVSIIFLIVLIRIYRDHITILAFCIMGIILIMFSHFCIQEETYNNDNLLQVIYREFEEQNIENSINRRIILELIRDKVVIYKMKKNDPHINQECVICLDNYEKETKACCLGCNHIYHKKCIEDWLVLKPTCPLCQYEVLERFDDILIHIDIDSNSENMSEIYSG